MSVASVPVTGVKTTSVSDRVSLLTIARLTMPKLGVSYLFTLLLSVFNRVMINELAIAAGLIGGLYFLYRLMNIFQVWAGRYADRRPIFGLRRTPMMFIGIMLASLSLVRFLLLPCITQRHAVCSAWLPWWRALRCSGWALP